MSVTGRGLGFSRGPAVGPEAHDPLTSQGERSWVVTCSCGWGRECASEWAAESVSRLHPQLGDLGVEHATQIEPPVNVRDGRQLPLT